MHDASTDAEPIAQNRSFAIDVAERVRRLPPYLFEQINQLMYQKRRAGSDVIDLGMGNPSDPPQELVVEKLAEAARDPKNHGYSPAQGILSLRREVAAKYLRRYGVRLDPQTEVTVCLGSKEGFSHICLALVGPGDTAIVPSPSYPAHLYAVAMAAANAILLEVGDSQKLLTDIDSVCRRLAPRPKLLVVNFPHNPTTAVVGPEFYVEIVRLARRHGFLVISDLAYADIMFDGQEAPSFLAAPGAIEVGVELTTMSKGYNMAGWRVGFASGNAEMLRALRMIKGYYDYGMFRPIQVAAILALRRTDRAVRAQSLVYQGRRDTLCEGLERIGWPVERPKATMFVWARLPEPWASRMGSAAFAMKLLRDGNVVVSPGAGFGPAGEGYVRMALVENEKRLRQAVRQIARCLLDHVP
jgi:alanine-synthesizing transaminase